MSRYYSCCPAKPVFFLFVCPFNKAVPKIAMRLPMVVRMGNRLPDRSLHTVDLMPQNCASNKIENMTGANPAIDFYHWHLFFLPLKVGN
jgi:hypothetical protein